MPGPLPTAQQVDLAYKQLVLLSSRSVQEAQRTLAVPVTTFYRERIEHGLVDPLPRCVLKLPEDLTFEEVLALVPILRPHGLDRFDPFVQLRAGLKKRPPTPPTEGQGPIIT